jgi:endonuclease YncB( thermonuclease family)
MIKIFLKFIFIFFLFQTSNADEIYGFPKVIDGDTVHIKAYKIRLEGIDAPEIKQQCQKAFLKISAQIGFTFKKDYSCGVTSKKKLIDKINKSQIKCISLSKDKYKRYLATCFKDNVNLNKWMVRTGFAVAYKRYSKDYVRDETYAKENKLGIWQGSFVRPEKWRKLN